MKKLTPLAMFLALVFAAPVALSAQLRQRRAGDEPVRERRAQDPTPRAKTAGTSPKREAKQEQAAEEVGEDDVVRVYAARVTVPVSVLDRDGRVVSGLR